MCEEGGVVVPPNFDGNHWGHQAQPCGPRGQVEFEDGPQCQTDKVKRNPRGKDFEKPGVFAVKKRRPKAVEVLLGRDHSVHSILRVPHRIVALQVWLPVGGAHDVQL